MASINATIAVTLILSSVEIRTWVSSVSVSSVACEPAPESGFIVLGLAIRTPHKAARSTFSDHVFSQDKSSESNPDATEAAFVYRCLVLRRFGINRALSAASSTNRWANCIHSPAISR